MYLGVWRDMTNIASQRNDLSGHPYQIYTMVSFGSTRTQPGKVVTRARGGQSWHNFRVAFDFVPVVHGKAVWTDLALFRRCGEIGESLGLEWGGRGQGMRDRPHMQYTGGLSLAEMRAGKVPK